MSYKVLKPTSPCYVNVSVYQFLTLSYSPVFSLCFREASRLVSKGAQLSRCSEGTGFPQLSEHRIAGGKSVDSLYLLVIH